MRTLALVCLFSAPAFAGEFASRPSGDEQSSAMEGLYAAAGGGGQFFISGDNGFGYDLEGKLGYSFGAPLQIFLSGAYDSATINGLVEKTIQVAAFLQYHLITRGRVMPYTRAGIGVCLVPDFRVPGQTGVGLAAAGGLGMEIQLNQSFFVAPEFFYRRATVSASGSSGDVQIVGLQLSLIYY
jgi:hypothetical protein